MGADPSHEAVHRGSSPRRRAAGLAGGVAVVLILAGATAGRSAPLEGSAVAATLTFRAALVTTTLRGDYCPPGSPPTLSCFRVDGRGVVRGLGAVTESHVYGHDGASCPSTDVHFPVIDAARFTVPGKGTIELVADAIPGCIPELQSVRPPRAFRITGGSGMFAGATGSGTVRQVITFGNVSTGTDTWEGSLTAPGVEFDLDPPRLTGAVAKTVRAQRGQRSARVTFAVVARDAVDGSVPVSCAPRSGTRFKLGRTQVTCTATDGSGNSATVRFRVTVRPR